jgi:hypothetical protein
MLMLATPLLLGFLIAALQYLVLGFFNPLLLRRPRQ